MSILDLKKRKIVIAALARDCELALIKNIPLIEKLRGYFGESCVVIVENDSIDNTKLILRNWECQSHNVTVLTKDNQTQTLLPQIGLLNTYRSLYRIQKMSYYRNVYLDYIEQINVKFDYVLMIDVDILSFSVEGIIAALSDSPSDFGGIFANGYTQFKIAGYTFGKLPHDMYAYVDKNITLNDVVKNSHEMNRVQKYLFVLNFIRKKILVNSAFGGIGIYQWNAIKGRRYKVVGRNSMDCQALCEHIPLNIEIAESGYKNYIDNRILVNYGTHKLGMTLFFLLPYNVANNLYLLYKKYKHLLYGS